MCQDDYDNVDNSCRRFENACDQLFADKTLCKHREYSLSEKQGDKRGRAAQRSGDGANVFTLIALYVHCVHTSKYGCMKSTTGTCMMHP